MRRIAYLFGAVVTLTGVVVWMAHASGHADEEAAPIFGLKIPPGYRDWRLVSVAHEEGSLNDIRAILGNDVAIKSYREAVSYTHLDVYKRQRWTHPQPAVMISV